MKIRYFNLIFNSFIFSCFFALVSANESNKRPRRLITPFNVLSALKRELFGPGPDNTSNNVMQDYFDDQTNAQAIPFNFDISKTCFEAKNLGKFIKYIIIYVIESVVDRDVALAKLNDLFHCELANSNFKNISYINSNYILNELNRRGVVTAHLQDITGNENYTLEEFNEDKKIELVQVLLEALETKIKDYPLGSTQLGLVKIYEDCNQNLYDIMLDLERKQDDQYKGLTKNVCTTGSCTADDLEKLKSLFMVRSIYKSPVVIPSECAHYSMKNDVIQMIDYIKAKFQVNQRPIPIEILKKEIEKNTRKQPETLRKLKSIRRDETIDLQEKLQNFILECKKVLATLKSNLESKNMNLQNNRILTLQPRQLQLNQAQEAAAAA